MAYGFGEKTGIELPQEAKSNISNITGGNRDIESRPLRWPRNSHYAHSYDHRLIHSGQRRTANEASYCKEESIKGVRESRNIASRS